MYYFFYDIIIIGGSVDSKKKLKISLFLNILIVLMTIFAFVVMFTDFKFMPGVETVIASSKVGRLRFFTIDSNLLMGITAFVFLIQQIKLLKGKIKKIDRKYYVLNLMATTAVALTFIVVLGYLGHITPNGLYSMYVNKNLFFHGLIPLVAIINFIFFTNTNKLKFRDTRYGLTYIYLYILYYIINIVMHVENNKVSPNYDWYYFVQGNICKAFIVGPLIILLSYFISYALWRFNKKNKLS